MSKGVAVDTARRGRIQYILKEFRQPQARAALGMLAITFIPLVLFSIIPMINCIRYAFTDFSMFADSVDWVGTANFQEAVQDERFWQMWWNTILYAVMTVPVQMILGLSIALLLNRRFRGIGGIRTLLYLPTLTSAVAVGYIFRSLFDPSFGFLNTLLKAVGLPPSYWLDDPATSLFSVAIVGVWMGFGVSMIIYSAGLQGIPTTFYEAAEIDGANWWQKIIHITVPLLRPVTLFLFITGIIGALQVYDLIMVMTIDPRGGPLGSTTTIVYSIYQNATRYHRMGYASALSLMLFVVLLLLTAVTFRFARGSTEIQY